MTKPLVVELAGTPRSGKSVLIDILDHYLRRNGFSTRVLAEGARTCPFDKKDHVQLTCWGANRVINNLLETMLVSGPTYDVVISDRGIFDILAFIHLLRLQGEITENEESVLNQYLLFGRWRTSIDVVFLLITTPEEALKREFKHKFVQKYGRIMNPQMLSQLNVCYKYVQETFGPLFSKVIRLDATNNSIAERAKVIVDTVVQMLSTRSQRSST